LHSNNKLPIVVGGTNYYLEALLHTDVRENHFSQAKGLKSMKREDFKKNNQDLYHELQELDDITAR